MTTYTVYRNWGQQVRVTLEGDDGVFPRADDSGRMAVEFYTKTLVKDDADFGPHYDHTIQAVITGVNTLVREGVKVEIFKKVKTEEDQKAKYEHKWVDINSTDDDGELVADDL